MLSRNDMHEYQHKAVNFITETKRCMLLLDMGLGKTVSTLTAVSDLIDSFAVRKTLVIAPLRVANSVWKQEVANWQHLHHLSVSICTGSAKERMGALQHDADIYVINRENVVWLLEHYKGKWPFDCVVVDESSSFKNASSKRFKALRKALPKINYMVLLTGTPSPNGLIDVWSQAYLIDFGMSLERTLTAYRRRFFEQDYSGFNWVIKQDGSDKKIHELMQPYTLSMQAEDYIDLPTRIDLSERVELPPKALKEYKAFEKSLFIELEGQEIEALSAAVLANKLLQFANGAMYTDEAHSWSLLHDAKIDAMKELVEQNEGENILVAYNYKSDLERLALAFPEAVVLDKEASTIARWNNGEIKMLLAHPACLHPKTEVLTEYRGWVKIIDVALEDRVFDGVEFVNHKGCHFSGVMPVVEKLGVVMTSDHKLLIDGEWVEAKDVRNTEDTRRKAHYLYAGDDNYLIEMLPLWGSRKDTKAECGQVEPPRSEALLDLQRGSFPQNDKHPNLENLERHGESSFECGRSGLQKVRGCRSRGGERMVDVREFSPRHVTGVCGSSNARAGGQREGILQGELQVGDQYGAAIEQEQHQNCSIRGGNHTPSRILQEGRGDKGCDYAKVELRNERGRGNSGLHGFEISKGAKEAVYDLVDCGPRNRFLIRNDKGMPIISHNSAGHGLNLQRGGSLAIWFGLNWSLELYQQFNARLHRQGQTKPVRIVHIVAEDTIDERVLSVLGDKDATQTALLKALI